MSRIIKLRNSSKFLIFTVIIEIIDYILFKLISIPYIGGHLPPHFIFFKSIITLLIGILIAKLLYIKINRILLLKWEIKFMNVIYSMLYVILAGTNFFIIFKYFKAYINKNNLNFYYFFSIILIGPIYEEIVDRGLFFKIFENKKRIYYILISSLYFSISHFFWTRYDTNKFFIFIMMFIIGIFLSKIYLITNNILFNIVNHAAINLTVTIQKVFFTYKETLNYRNVIYFILIIQYIFIIYIVFARRKNEN